MAGSYGGFDVTFRSEGDLSAESNRYLAVEPGAAAGEIDVTDTRGDFCVGILQNRPNTDENAVVRVLGVSKYIADEAIAVGGILVASVATAGQLTDFAAASNLTDDDFIVGYAIQTPSFLVPTAGGVIGIMIVCPSTIGDAAA